jgi:uncharacterized protein YrrD
MRLSELLGVEVVDEHGTVAGSVHDVRLVQDGPMVGTFGASFRVAGLVIGSRAIGSRLGYDRGTLRRLWLLKAAFGYWHRGARYVAWERIRSLGTDRIVITGTAGDLPHPTPAD